MYISDFAKIPSPHPLRSNSRAGKQTAPRRLLRDRVVVIPQLRNSCAFVLQLAFFKTQCALNDFDMLYQKHTLSVGEVLQQEL